MAATLERETAAAPVAEAPDCPHCHGKGEVGIWVDWSDGMGGSSATCPLCDGRKTVDTATLLKEFVALKTVLPDLLYKAWLVAGCHVVSYREHAADRKTSHIPCEWHTQEIRNDVLRAINALPESVGGGHKIDGRRN